MPESTIQDAILDQNSELDIEAGCIHRVFKPVFKRGPRDREDTNWVVEVNPSFYENIRKVEAWSICILAHGHPAAKCNEKQTTCAHCGRKGHLAETCPAEEADPSCANCHGKHNARERSCSARTNYLVGRARRTNYGKTK